MYQALVTGEKSRSVQGSAHGLANRTGKVYPKGQKKNSGQTAKWVVQKDSKPTRGDCWNAVTREQDDLARGWENTARIHTD